MYLGDDEDGDVDYGIPEGQNFNLAVANGISFSCDRVSFEMGERFTNRRFNRLAVLPHLAE
jgi:hypothetical protein